MSANHFVYVVQVVLPTLLSQDIHDLDSGDLSLSVTGHDMHDFHDMVDRKSVV